MKWEEGTALTGRAQGSSDPPLPQLFWLKRVEEVSGEPPRENPKGESRIFRLYCVSGRACCLSLPSSWFLVMKSEAKVNLPLRAAISISILPPQVDRFHILSVN